MSATIRTAISHLSRSLEIINTMQNMVQEILTVSHIKSSNMRVQKESIDFSAMLSHEVSIVLRI